jgi:hypothetical protein
VHDSYTGVGLDYTQNLGAAGEVLWQVYGGNTYDLDPPQDSRDRRAYGGRVTYSTPLDGLRLMVSSYKTDVELLATRQTVNEWRTIYSIDFVHDNWDIKAEAGHHTFMAVSSTGYYVQAGRTLGDKWTPFVRYDSVVLDTRFSGNDSSSQKIVVLGLNYKIQPNISLRIENHFNRGYALPVASGEVPAGAGARNWDLLVAGVHFMF